MKKQNYSLKLRLVRFLYMIRGAEIAGKMNAEWFCVRPKTLKKDIIGYQNKLK